MPRYRNAQSVRVYVPEAAAEVDPGEEFDSPVELSNETLVPVKSKAAKADSPAQEAK